MKIGIVRLLNRSSRSKMKKAPSISFNSRTCLSPFDGSSTMIARVNQSNFEVTLNYMREISFSEDQSLLFFI